MSLGRRGKEVYEKREKKLNIYNICERSNFILKAKNYLFLLGLIPRRLRGIYNWLGFESPFSFSFFGLSFLLLQRLRSNYLFQIGIKPLERNEDNDNRKKIPN
ncbi:hypothetical protein D5R40_02675 [Okeania hirsuta]|uniref:Uncharacterized protein n=1 Tax=Okeania hirsuta TaxID=1458930 RepID=A0A3N6PHQ0_9CYAN|nr:hypothetical protein D4Z78_08445 [Okeania hirsuta]RQH55351.1 hypothetical protein D5R40_02675 [Okeania hirsuta]